VNGQKELLRPSDLATVLGVSIGRVYQLIAAGEIPATRIGRALRIPRAAWELWLDRVSDEALASLRSSVPATPKIGVPE
jgi:excisionase family DNA binding protein